MNDLAEGFARHLVAWAQTLQAPADSLAVLRNGDEVGRRMQRDRDTGPWGRGGVQFHHKGIRGSALNQGRCRRIGTSVSHIQSGAVAVPDGGDDRRRTDTLKCRISTADGVSQDACMADGLDGFIIDG